VNSNVVTHQKQINSEFESFQTKITEVGTIGELSSEKKRKTTAFEKAANSNNRSANSEVQQNNFMEELGSAEPEEA